LNPFAESWRRAAQGWDEATQTWLGPSNPAVSLLKLGTERRKLETAGSKLIAVRPSYFSFLEGEFDV
jgi:hypothetical protein